MFFIFIIFKIYFIYFLAALGLCCCTPAFSSCCEWGLLFIVVRGLLIAVAALLEEHQFQARGLQQLWHTGSVVVALGLSSCGPWALERRLSSCGARASLLRDIWDLPGPGLKPASPALAGEFLTTAPPGKPQLFILDMTITLCLFFFKKCFQRYILSSF